MTKRALAGARVRKPCCVDRRPRAKSAQITPFPSCLARSTRYNGGVKLQSLCILLAVALGFSGAPLEATPSPSKPSQHSTPHEGAKPSKPAPAAKPARPPKTHAHAARRTRLKPKLKVKPRRRPVVRKRPRPKNGARPSQRRHPTARPSEHHPEPARPHPTPRVGAISHPSDFPWYLLLTKRQQSIDHQRELQRNALEASSAKTNAAAKQSGNTADWWAGDQLRPYLPGQQAAGNASDGRTSGQPTERAFPTTSEGTGQPSATSVITK